MRRQFPTLNVALFALTVLTTLAAGAELAPLGAKAHGAKVGLSALAHLKSGLPFAATLLTILIVHELGHYLAMRRHRVDATLPYFVPVPFGIGTLGAYMQIRSPIPSRNAVLDIGASGPLAGFVTTLPFLFWGFATSPAKEVPPLHLNSYMQSPFSFLMHVLQGRPLLKFSESPVVIGENAMTWLATHLTHGTLLPNHEIAMNSVAFAAWIGLFVTALNLIPLGQLDGGHVVYALFGRQASKVFRALSWGLLLLGIFAAWTWLVWWVLVRFVIGTEHPASIEEVEPLDPGRRAVAIASLVVFAITFVPIPFHF